MRVAMIGAGYVGLVSGAYFADFGHVVCCVDNDARRVAELESGRIPIFEPGLDDLVASNVRAGRLTFTSELKAAVSPKPAETDCVRQGGRGTSLKRQVLVGLALFVVLSTPGLAEAYLDRSFDLIGILQSPPIAGSAEDMRDLTAVVLEQRIATQERIASAID